jgi:hypothetical protein
LLLSTGTGVSLRGEGVSVPLVVFDFFPIEFFLRFANYFCEDTEEEQQGFNSIKNSRFSVYFA